MRHARTRAQFTAQERRDAGVVAPRSDGDQVVQSMQELLFDRLRQAIEPHHNWNLIGLAAFLYLCLVGPVHWHVSRRLNDWRWSNLALIGTVALFCWLFLGIGARGYGEQQQVSTLGWARDLGDDAWRVTLYNNVFATSGDVYHLAHGAEHALYSAAQEHEAVRGMIHNGRQGSFAVDIPLFSNRPFVCAGRFAHPSLRLLPQDWPEGNDAKSLTGFSVQVEGPFPEQVLGICFLHRDSMWHGRKDGNRIHGTGVVHYLDQELHVAEWRRGERQQQRNWPRFGQTDEPAPALRTIAGEAFETLLVEQLGLRNNMQRPEDDERDRIQVFVLARAPAAFAVHCPGLERNEGYVVFHTDLIKER
jgi:hypothetical protein